MVLAVLWRCTLNKLHHLFVATRGVRWVQQVRHAAFIALAVVVRARRAVPIITMVMVATVIVYRRFNLQHNTVKVSTTEAGFDKYGDVGTNFAIIHTPSHHSSRRSAYL